MNQLHPRHLALAAFAAAAFAAFPAHAQDAPEDDAAAEEGAGEDGAFDITATATLVSDYRYRGVSLTDRGPAVQGSVEVNWNGFYAGAWTTTVARTADTNVELDLYAGYYGTAGPIEYEVGAQVYLYPGGDGTATIYEATGNASYTLGPATARLLVEYAPDQENLAGDNLYVSADVRVGVPTTPFTVFAQVGREDGSFYGRKLDWSLGVDYIQGPFTMSLGYFDTDLDPFASGLGRAVRGGVVFTAGFEF